MLHTRSPFLCCSNEIQINVLDIEFEADVLKGGECVHFTIKLILVIIISVSVVTYKTLYNQLIKLSFITYCCFRCSIHAKENKISKIHQK